MNTKYIHLIILIFVYLNCYSQNSYEKGYYINNDNQKINCLIKNLNWENNPIEFDYKLTQENKPKKLNLKSVKEFSINNTCKYIRWIEKNSNNREKENYIKKNIESKEKFLKVLVEGYANLYIYKNENDRKFFFSKQNDSVQELIYKPYDPYNNQYKYQIWDHLKCKKINKNDVNRLYYKQYKLVPFFENFNNCIGYNYINYEKLNKQDVFNLNIKTGINYSIFTAESQNLINVPFENQLTLSFGTEAEFILPSFHKNKWALTLEPTFNYFKSKSEILNMEIDYKSIGLSTGLRYYFFINDKSNFFINSFYNLDLINFNSFLIDYDFNENLLIENFNRGVKSNFTFGLGYKYNNKYIIELRYNAPKNLLSSYLNKYSKFQSISMILGYSIF